MIESYFQPIAKLTQVLSGTAGAQIPRYEKKFPDLSKCQVAIIGCGWAADRFRSHFYQLSWRFGNLNVADLGNLAGGDENSRSHALSEALAELMEKGIFVIVIGDETDRSSAQFRGYRHLLKDVEYALIAPDVPLKRGGFPDEALSSESNLFNIHFMCTQSYLVTQEQTDLMEKLYFENHRLGYLREYPEEAEPTLRTSHMCTFNMRAVRHSDAPGTGHYNPNGLYAEEAVRLSRYAGTSHRLSSILFQGFGSEQEQNLSPVLLAQMVWYLLDGFQFRNPEEPSLHPDQFVIYRNILPGTGHELVFLKSMNSDRWWMEIPNPGSGKPFYIGCSYADYQKVCNDEIPDRWLKAWQRVM